MFPGFPPSLKPKNYSDGNLKISSSPPYHSLIYPYVRHHLILLLIHSESKVIKLLYTIKNRLNTSLKEQIKI